MAPSSSTVATAVHAELAAFRTQLLARFSMPLSRSRPRPKEKPLRPPWPSGDRKSAQYPLHPIPGSAWDELLVPQQDQVADRAGMRLAPFAGDRTGKIASTKLNSRGKYGSRKDSSRDGRRALSRACSTTDDGSARAYSIRAR